MPQVLGSLEENDPDGDEDEEVEDLGEEDGISGLLAGVAL